MITNFIIDITNSLFLNLNLTFQFYLFRIIESLESFEHEIPMYQNLSSN